MGKFLYRLIVLIIDHFISDYIHKRTSLNFFEERGINLTEYYEECITFKNISMYEIETTPKVGIMASSPIFKDILHFMDNIIESNIKNETEKNKILTKFVMYSGHDYIIVAVQIFLHEAFGIECFYPGFAANQFFELHKQDGIDKNKLNEDNFYVQYFFNGNLLLNISYTEFKRKITEILIQFLGSKREKKKGQIVNKKKCLYKSLEIAIIAISACDCRNNLAQGMSV